jgi:hypothetical protein
VRVGQRTAQLFGDKGYRVEYLDFELEIGTGSGHGRTYPVTVIASPGGETHGTLRFPFDDTALENRLLIVENALLRSSGGDEIRRRSLAPEEQAVQDFGQKLFDSLLADDVRSCYEVSRNEARRQEKGLRLKLRIQAPDLTLHCARTSLKNSPTTS